MFNTLLIARLATRSKSPFDNNDFLCLHLSAILLQPPLAIIFFVDMISRLEVCQRCVCHVMSNFSQRLPNSPSLNLSLYFVLWASEKAWLYLSTGICPCTFEIEAPNNPTNLTWSFSFTSDGSSKLWIYMWSIFFQNYVSVNISMDYQMILTK